MNDFLRDPIWQFIGAILGFLAIVISLAVFFLQRRKKSLVYEVLTSTPLLTLSDEIKGRVQILFEGLPVQNVHLIILHILNEGNIAITSPDYEKPLSIQFNEGVQIIDAEIIKTIPETLKPEFNLEKNKVEFTPTLLNSGDAIFLKVLLAHYDDSIMVSARIMGVAEIRHAGNSYKKLNNAIALTGLGGLILMFVSLFTNSGTLAIISLVVVAIAMIFIDVLEKRRKKVRVYVPSKIKK